MLSLIQDVIKKEYGRMNDMQFDAVTTVNGPVLILAGAGSGKTTVLVNRVANIIKYGNAYFESPEIFSDEKAIAEDFVNGNIDLMPELSSIKYSAPAPWQILAITFTNKAANELKERLVNMLGEDGEKIWAGTFHSTCAKILRFDGDKIGYSSHFTIYDADDQKRVVKECMKRLGIDDGLVHVKSVIYEISSAKDSLIDCDEYEKSAGYDERKRQIARVYKLYSRTLADSDAMDFDDLIFNTVRLFSESPQTLEKYQNKFRYIMVDEYQDTSHAQYVLVRELAKKSQNICVVGDDDQSIYSFRGATIENILNFEKEYGNAKVIRLEQNYRSTSNILNAANAVISHNYDRKGKNLWTDNGDGDKVVIHTTTTEQEEARYVADTILDKMRAGEKLSDCAVLYRMNAQSNAIENVFMRLGIPYKIVGGFRFYERKEIKDVMSYLSFINNPADNLRLSRIINEPKRGIGNATVEKAIQIATATGRTLFDIISHSDEFALLSRASSKLLDFSRLMQSIIDVSDDIGIYELLELVLDKSGYMTALRNQGVEAQDRIENVNELLSNILLFEQENENATLSDFLEQIALITDLDNFDQSDDRVVMMTLHSAKGLEFDNVFIIGLEEGIFPGTQSIYGGDKAIEEERRLAYVGITRAKRSLHITNAKSRVMFGKTTNNSPSRFLDEIPPQYAQIETPAVISSGFDGFSEYKQKNSSKHKFRDFASQKSAPAKPTTTTFNIGDNVHHKVFGDGMVLNVRKMGNDSLLEIAFESVGTKKIMANFSGITKN